jgi:hypothetical protein
MRFWTNITAGCKPSATLRRKRLALLLIGLSGALMIPGCAPSAPPKPVDLAAVRCPPIAGADARALSQRPTAPPAGDMTDAKLRAWVDDKDRAISSMRLAGGRVIRQYDRCRTGNAGS